MEITKINEEPYTQERKSEIEGRKYTLLEDVYMKATYNPYSFGSTGDVVTIRFEEDDWILTPEGDRIIYLPFQTNTTWVSNHTDYKGKPGWNWLKNMFLGKLDYVSAEQLDEFLYGVSYQMPFLRELVLKQKKQTRQGKNPWSSIGRKKSIKKGSEDFKKRVSELEKNFVSFPKDFRIDPTSHVRVEKRTTRNEGEIYTASLKLFMYRGLAGAPGIDTRFIQEIKARFDLLR